MNLFVLDKKTIKNMLMTESKKNDILPETEKVLDILWETSKSSFSHLLRQNLKKIQNLKEGYRPDRTIPNNWRDMLNHYE